MKMKKLFFTVLFFGVLFSAKAQEQFVVYFDSNKHELNQPETEKLNQWLTLNKESKIVAINGFTDEDGSHLFNDSLAKRRVNFVFNFVQNKIKIRDDFKSRSYGEDFKQAINKAENRKVTLYYIEQKDLAKEDEILGIKTEIPETPKPEISFPDTLVFENPNGTKSEFMLDVNFMKSVSKAIPGEKLKIENLNFMINTYIVVNESRGKLYELLLVLQKNPKLKIEIQGNICCMPNDRLNLSMQRAKAIYNFLIANEINKNRLSYKGFGSTRPIFALPEKTEEERAANRRVEVLILEN
jgi:outer membrane protein OmpA-like peptidoglycan-associated protein